MRKIYISLFMIMSLFFSPFTAYAVDSIDDSDVTSVASVEEDYLPPIEDSEDESDYDPATDSEMYTKGGIYYSYEKWGFVIISTTAVVAVIILFRRYLRRKTGE